MYDTVAYTLSKSPLDISRNRRVPEGLKKEVEKLPPKSFHMEDSRIQGYYAVVVFFFLRSVSFSLLFLSLQPQAPTTTQDDARSEGPCGWYIGSERYDPRGNPCTSE